MSQTYSLDTPADFAHLVPLNSLPATLLAEVLSKSRLETLEAETLLCRRGQFDEDVIYLLRGTVDLVNADGDKTGLRSDARQAEHPLAPGRPRKVDIQARTQVTVLRIASAVLDSCLLWSQAAAQSGTGEQIFDDGVLPCSGLFSYIPAVNVNQISERLERIERDAGAIIMRQGEDGDYYYMLRSGHCVVWRDESGQRIEIAELVPGDTFGEEALVSDSRRNASVTATSDCVLDRLTKQDFVDLIQTPLLDELDRDNAAAAVQAGARWLDVRLPAEYKRAAIADSINMPLSTIRSRCDELDKQTIYITVCDTGNRSAAAAFLLAERGFTVKHLNGGLLESRSSGGPGTDPVVASAGAALAAQLDEVRREVEAALLKKVAADASLAAVEDQARRLKTRKDQALLSELAGQLKSDSRRLTQEARDTEKALQKAQRARLKLEEVLLAFEKLARQGMEDARQEQQDLSTRSGEKLAQGEQRLEAEYARASQALEAIARKQQEHEQSTGKKLREFETLICNTDEELRALDEKRAQLVDERDSLQAQLEDFRESADKIRQGLDEREQRIRVESEERLHQERVSLEAEFVRSMELIDVARKRQQEAEAAMRQAQEARQEAERKARLLQQKMQADAERKLAERRTRLMAEEQEIQAALKAAQDVEKTVRDARRAVSNETSGAALQRELTRRDQELQSARARVEAAKAAQLENQISQRVVNGTIKRWDGREDTLRRQVKNELAEWLELNEEREQQESQALRTIRGHLKKVNERLEQEKAQDRAATHDMFDEIRHMLNEDD